MREPAAQPSPHRRPTPGRRRPQKPDPRVEALAEWLRVQEVLDVAFPPPAPGSEAHAALVSRAWGGISDLLRAGYRSRAAAILGFVAGLGPGDSVVCPCCGQPVQPPSL